MSEAATSTNDFIPPPGALDAQSRARTKMIAAMLLGRIAHEMGMPAEVLAAIEAERARADAEEVAALEAFCAQYPEAKNMHMKHRTLNTTRPEVAVANGVRRYHGYTTTVTIAVVPDAREHAPATAYLSAPPAVDAAKKVNHV